MLTLISARLGNTSSYAQFSRISDKVQVAKVGHSCP